MITQLHEIKRLLFFFTKAVMMIISIQKLPRRRTLIGSRKISWVTG